MIMVLRHRSLRIEVRRLARDRRAVTALEYGLLTGLIALVIAGALTMFGGNASTLFTHIANTI
jgi:pilus assembly protein Flp/PilA